MVILVVFLLLSTYICSAPPSMPGGLKWTNMFSPALKLSLMSLPRSVIFDAGCWHSPTPHTTTSTNHLRPRKRVRTKSPCPSPLIMPTIRNVAVLPTTATTGDVLPGVGGATDLIMNKEEADTFVTKVHAQPFPIFPPLAHAPFVRAVFPAWRLPKPCTRPRRGQQKKRRPRRSRRGKQRWLLASLPPRPKRGQSSSSLRKLSCRKLLQRWLLSVLNWQG
jgi:hypothetical protein